MRRECLRCGSACKGVQSGSHTAGLDLAFGCVPCDGQDAPGTACDLRFDVELATIRHLIRLYAEAATDVIKLMQTMTIALAAS